MVLQRAYLIDEQSPGGPRRVPVDGQLVLGRSLDCGCVVDDTAASRRHGQIELQTDGEYVWRDLGSTNGTLLNGTKVLEGRLKQGDRLQIGKSVFRFEIEEAAETETGPGEGTLFKRTIVTPDGAFKSRRTEPSKAEAILQSVYGVIHSLSNEYEPTRLVDKVLEETARALRAERCAIVFTDGPDEPLRPCPGHEYCHIFENGTLKEVEPDALGISRTVVNRVLTQGESVFFHEDANDIELNTAKSILMLRLRSIICVPLRGRQRVFGILYLDTSETRPELSEDDWLLSSAIGNSAGLALENALLHQQILENERVEQELKIAWTIQEGFLFRDWPENETAFEVYGETRPAKTVGGDFYDVFLPGNGKVGIAIGDVSGKGMPAALTMAKLLAEFRVCARIEESPAHVLSALNESLVRSSQRGIFCTFCYCLLDLDSGRMCIANAGHHPPLLIADGVIDEFAIASGPPLGIMEGLAWDEQETHMTPDTLAILYTDGIVEARPGTAPSDTLAQGEALEEYGLEGLGQSILKGSGTVASIIEHIMADVASYCGEQPPHDDCTLIGLRYRGS
jgi:phosphoserine phosphatase RsbU/P